MLPGRNSLVVRFRIVLFLFYSIIEEIVSPFSRTLSLFSFLNIISNHWAFVHYTADLCTMELQEIKNMTGLEHHVRDRAEKPGWLTLVSCR